MGHWLNHDGSAPAMQLLLKDTETVPQCLTGLFLKPVWTVAGNPTAIQEQIAEARSGVTSSLPFFVSFLGLFRVVYWLSYSLQYKDKTRYKRLSLVLFLNTENSISSSGICLNVFPLVFPVVTCQDWRSGGPYSPKQGWIQTQTSAAQCLCACHCRLRNFIDNTTCFWQVTEPHVCVTSFLSRCLRLSETIQIISYC